MAWKRLSPVEGAEVYVDGVGGNTLTLYVEEYEYRRKPHKRMHWRFASPGLLLSAQIEGVIPDTTLTNEEYTKHYKKDEVSFLEAIEYELLHCTESYTEIFSKIRGYDDGTGSDRVDFVNVDPNTLSRDELINLVMEVQGNSVAAVMEESKEEE